MLGTIATAVVQATMVSAVYALIAIGFTMIFGVGGILNLAHGALIMAGAYLYGMLTTTRLAPSIEVHVLVGLAITVGAIAILSLLLYEVLVKWVEDNVVVTFLSTVIVAVAFTELLLWYFGDSSRMVNLYPGARTFDLIGTVQYYEVIGFVVSWIAIGLLWFYVTKTDDGRSILATSMSERGAHLTGVNIHAVRAKTWLIAGALAGLGGIFVGLDGGVQPLMWLNPLAIAFVVVVVGGIGSIKGSVVGAYLIGFIEQLTVETLGHGFRIIPALLLLALFLLLRPEGLYGREFVHE